MKFTTLLLLCLLTVGEVFALGPTSYNGNPRTADITAGSEYSPYIGSVIRAEISGGVSGATTFQVSSLVGLDDDFFNTTWRVRAVTATNVTDGSVWDITDYVSSSGTFTTQSADGNWAVGDVLEISKAYMLDAAEFGLAGVQAVATGKVTTASGANSVIEPDDADTITVATFEGLNTTLFSGLATGQTSARYYLRFAAADEAGDGELIGQYRAIRSLSAAGVVIYEPGFDVGGSVDIIDAGDIVEIVPMGVINPNPPMFYRGTVLSGSATTAIFPELIGIDDAITVGATIKCIHDKSGSEEGRLATVSSFTAATGTVTFTAPTTNTLSPTVNDQYEIQWTAAGEMLVGANGIPTTLTATRLIAGVSGLEGQKWIEAAVDTINEVKLEYAEQLIEDLRDSLNNRTIHGLVANIDFSSATWNTQAAHEVFDVSGDVEFWLTVSCSTLVDANAASDSTCFGIATTAGGGAYTKLASFLSEGIDADEQVYWLSAAAAGTVVPAAGGLSLVAETVAGGATFHGISRSLDIGYEQIGGAGVSGILRFNCQWRPVVPNSGATVIAGLGGAL